MKYWQLIILGGAVLLLVAYYFGVYKNNTQQLAQQYEMRSDETPPVLVKVTPLQITKSAPWKFEVIFTTHSGDLNFDPKDIVILKDENGTEYPAISWDGPGSGGHHITGIATFEPIKPQPKVLTFIIKEVGENPARSFQWDIK